MRIKVNNTYLFFDVEGSALATNERSFREKPTLIALHGGPGIDHADVRGLAPLSNAFQIVYLDQRGNGRSDRSTPDKWNLATWADDIRAFCDALGIHKPIVFGNSFGGLVALAYATRYPHHPSKLILHATTTHFDLEGSLQMFAQLGGQEAVSIARKFFSDPTDEAFDQYRRACLPLYSRLPARASSVSSMIHLDVAKHFIGGDWHRFDFRSSLSAIACPTLILTGRYDCVFPVKYSQEMAAGIRPDLVQLEILEHCGHALLNDDPARVRQLIESFAKQI